MSMWIKVNEGGCIWIYLDTMGTSARATGGAFQPIHCWLGIPTNTLSQILAPV